MIAVACSLKVKETVSATSCLLEVDCEGEEETLIGENVMTDPSTTAINADDDVVGS
jgi:hypothetical protein